MIPDTPPRQVLGSSWAVMSVPKAFRPLVIVRFVFCGPKKAPAPAKPGEMSAAHVNCFRAVELVVHAWTHPTWRSTWAKRQASGEAGFAMGTMTPDADLPLYMYRISSPRRIIMSRVSP